MRLSIRIIQGKICVCEKGTGYVVDVIGTTGTPCDGLIRGFDELPILKDDCTKKTYARYRLDVALRRAEKMIADGLCPELALFPLRSLFVRDRVSA